MRLHFPLSDAIYVRIISVFLVKIRLEGFIFFVKKCFTLLEILIVIDQDRVWNFGALMLIVKSLPFAICLETSFCISV